MFEHIEPKGAGGAADAHMVRHEVKQNSHLPTAQCRYQPPEILQRTEFRIDPAVIHRVIAMRTARTCHQDGREIGVADAQFGQMANDGLRVAAGEIPVQLQAISLADRDQVRASDVRTMAVSAGRMEN